LSPIRESPLAHKRLGSFPDMLASELVLMLVPLQLRMKLMFYLKVPKWALRLAQNLIQMERRLAPMLVCRKVSRFSQQLMNVMV
jgi:hypothetical protein